MNLNHVALVCSSEENADGFFGNLLGLKKSEPKIVSRAVSEAIFRIGSELKVINYLSESVRFEIFIYSYNRDRSKAGPIEHVCLEVDDLTGFLGRCRSLNLKILQVPKGESLVTFISDFDDNLFELKEK